MNWEMDVDAWLLYVLNKNVAEKSQNISYQWNGLQTSEKRLELFFIFLMT